DSETLFQLWVDFFQTKPLSSFSATCFLKYLHCKSDRPCKPTRAIQKRIYLFPLRQFMESIMPGFANIRVHDLKHTFGRRLRAAGVPLETRKVLLGHKNGDITSHYSAPEIDELLEATNRVCRAKSGKSPAMTLLKRKIA
ncbi:MAG: tyrosine-type recombinase/integrase, partial [Gallionella sp.]|nr:tyrosine-type recombinase/integrase [Gallionella sp.]